MAGETGGERVDDQVDDCTSSESDLVALLIDKSKPPEVLGNNVVISGAIVLLAG